MQSVGVMRVFYPHLNRITGRVKLGVLPPIADRHFDWMKAKTADAFVSAVRVQCEEDEEELLIMRIIQLLDVPVFSDQDQSNNIFYMVVSHSRTLYCTRLSHAPCHMNLKHPCAMFLVVQALCDAGMVTLDLVKHISCVLSLSCDKSQQKWYTILTMFLDDLQRALSVSVILMKENGLTKHTDVVSRPVCCLEHTYYLTKGDCTVKKDGWDPRTSLVHSVVSAHQHIGAEGEHRYISEHAALEVAASVFSHG